MITLILMLMTLKGEPVLWLRWHEQFTKVEDCKEYSETEKFRTEVAELVHRYGKIEEHEFKFMVLCKAADKA